MRPGLRITPSENLTSTVKPETAELTPSITRRSSCLTLTLLGNIWRFQTQKQKHTVSGKVTDIRHRLTWLLHHFEDDSADVQIWGDTDFKRRGVGPQLLHRHRQIPRRHSDLNTDALSVTCSSHHYMFITSLLLNPTSASAQHALGFFLTNNIKSIILDACEKLFKGEVYIKTHIWTLNVKSIFILYRI